MSDSSGHTPPIHSSSSELFMYATSFLFGITSAMPFEAVVSAPSFMIHYYKYAISDKHAESMVPFLWANIFAFYSVLSSLIQLVGWVTVFRPWFRRLSLAVKFRVSLMLIMMQILAIVSQTVVTVGEATAIVILGLAIIVGNMGQSYLNAASLTLISAMPSKFTTAFMMGGAFSGAVMSTLQCIIKVSMANDYGSVLLQSYIYFGLAFGITMVTMLAALCLRWNRFVQQYVVEYRMARRKSLSLQRTDRLSRQAGVLDSRSAIDAIVEDGVCAKRDENLPSAGQPHDDRAIAGTQWGVVVATPSGDPGLGAAQDSIPTAQPLQNTTAIAVIKILYPLMFTMSFVLTISVLAFPSLFIAIDRSSEWFATIMVLLYNCGSAMGCVSLNFRVLQPSRKVALISSYCLVFLLIPIVFSIYGHIHGHALPYAVAVLLGFCSGFLITLLFLYAPKTSALTTGGQRAMANQLMGMSLSVGVFLGGVLAISVVMLLPQ